MQTVEMLMNTWIQNHDEMKLQVSKFEREGKRKTSTTILRSNPKVKIVVHGGYGHIDLKWAASAGYRWQGTSKKLQVSTLTVDQTGEKPVEGLREPLLSL